MMRAGYFQALLYLSTVDRVSYKELDDNIDACTATKADVIRTLRIFHFIDRIVENDPEQPLRPYYKINSTGLELLKLLKDTEKYEKHPK